MTRNLSSHWELGFAVFARRRVVLHNQVVTAPLIYEYSSSRQGGQHLCLARQGFDLITSVAILAIVTGRLDHWISNFAQGGKGLYYSSAAREPKSRFKTMLSYPPFPHASAFPLGVASPLTSRIVVAISLVHVLEPIMS